MTLPGADRLNPLHYYWELEWDVPMQDRFWAWVDAALADEIAETARLTAFAAERDPGLWHPGIAGRFHPATRSWKQTRFDFANVQLTFHELDNGEIGGRRCVLVEPDVDYYKDLLAHGLLEAIPNWLTQGKTNPEAVYALRWMAGRHEALSDFDPPCTLEA